MNATIPSAKAGDVLVIEGNRLGQSRRTGEILQVLNGDGHVRYRVRWEDGRETLYYPSGQAVLVRHPERRARTRKKT
jgi:hypothetical protein